MTDDGHQRARLGCAGLLAAFNSAAIGLVAAAFVRGPFSSAEQAEWYRGGSLALLVASGIAPGIALATVARRSARATIGLTMWMLVALALFYDYLLNSGGGV